MRTHEEPVAGEHRPARRHASDASQAAPRAALGAEILTPAAVLHLQRTAGNASVVQLLADAETDDAPSPVLDVVGSGGHPLDAPTRDFMESRLGHDFGDVRIHTDGAAGDSARSVQANAYTVGNDVVFGAGQWSPGTDDGRRTLAHELTHVVQQKAGPVDGTPAPGGIRVSDPSDRFEREADQMADRAMAAPAEAPPIQRQEEEEEEVQASAVQREEEEEEQEVQE